MDTRQAAGWASNGEVVTTLRSPHDVLGWLRQQADALRLDRTQRSEPLFSGDRGGDRGKAAKQLAAQGESVEFSHHGTLIRVEASRG